MDEIVLAVDPDVLKGWRSEPVTEKVVEFLEKMRDAYRLQAVQMPTQAYTAEKIALEFVRLQGLVDGIDEVLDVLKGGVE